MPAFPNLKNRTWNYSADDNLLSGLDVGNEAHYVPVFACPYAEKVPGFAEGNHTQGVGQTQYVPDWNRIAPAQRYSEWVAENPDKMMGGEYNGFMPEATFNDPNLVNAIRAQQEYTDAEEFKNRTAPTVKRLTLEQMIEQYMEAILRDKRTMAHIMSQAHMLKGATPFEQREFIRSMVTRQLSMGTTPQYQQTQQTLMDYFGIPTMQEPQAAAGAGLAPPAPPPAPGSSVAATYAGSESTATTYSASSAASSVASTEPSYTPSVQELVNQAMGRVDYLTSSIGGSLTDSRPSSPEFGRTRLTQAALMAHQMERNRFAIGGEEQHEDAGEYMAPTAISDESRFGGGGVFTSFAIPSAPANRDGFGDYAGAAPLLSPLHGSTMTIGSAPIDVTKGGRPIYGSESQGSTISRGRGSEPSEPSFDPSVSSGERERHRQRLSGLKAAKAESSSSGPVVPGKPRGKKKGKN
jgi:hypothetical protein